MQIRQNILNLLFIVLRNDKNTAFFVDAIATLTLGQNTIWQSKYAMEHIGTIPIKQRLIGLHKGVRQKCKISIPSLNPHNRQYKIQSATDQLYYFFPLVETKRCDT